VYHRVEPDVEFSHIAILIMQMSAMRSYLGLVPREVLLERFMDLFLGYWSGEHDIHGLGVLCRNYRARSVVHRT